MLLTRPPLTPKGPLDLHVLSLPPAFALSQDQTLKLKELIIADHKSSTEAHRDAVSSKPGAPKRRPEPASHLTPQKSSPKARPPEPQGQTPPTLPSLKFKPVKEQDRDPRRKTRKTPRRTGPAGYQGTNPRQSACPPWQTVVPTAPRRIPSQRWRAFRAPGDPCQPRRQTRQKHRQSDKTRQAKHKANTPTDAKHRQSKLTPDRPPAIR